MKPRKARHPRKEWKWEDIGDGLESVNYDKFIRVIRKPYGPPDKPIPNKYRYKCQVWHGGEWHDLHGQHASMTKAWEAAGEHATQRRKELQLIEEWRNIT